MDKLLTPITLVESALWISFHELLCCKWLTYCTFSLLWLCNVLALSSWVCVLSRGQNSWNSKFSTPFYLILKTSAVLCLQMYLIKISKLISWGNKFILSFKKSSVLFQVIPPYLHFTHLPTHSSSPSTILTPPLHSHPTPSPPLPTPPSPLFASPNSALLSISSYLISVLIKCFFFIILAVFTKALCQLMEVMCGPLLQTLENRLQVNLKRTAALETEKEMLEKEINSVKAELQGSMWERETAELFITKIIAENKLKENSVTSERLRCEIG